MKLIYICFLLVVLVALPTTVNATGLEKLDVEASIIGDYSVSYSLKMVFDEPLIKLNYPLSFRIKNLTSINNFGDASCRAITIGRVDSIDCDFVGMTQNKKSLTLEFTTSEEISLIEEKRKYSSTYFSRLPVNKTSFLVRLPERGTLSEQPTNNSYYPSDASVRTDGKYIMVYWEKENIKPGDTLTYSISCLMTGGEFSIFYNTFALLLIIVVIIIGFILLFFRRHTTTKSKELLVSVLDKDEKTVYDILVVHQGAVSQKVIVRESNFSKAKVSRVLRRLKSRNIIGIEPISGRENKIILTHLPGKKTEAQPNTQAEQGENKQGSGQENTDTQ